MTITKMKKSPIGTPYRISDIKFRMDQVGMKKN